MDAFAFDVPRAPPLTEIGTARAPTDDDDTRMWFSVPHAHLLSLKPVVRASGPAARVPIVVSAAAAKENRPSSKSRADAGPVTRNKRARPPETVSSTASSSARGRSSQLAPEMAAVLEAHNRKFQPKVAYEPRQFGVRDIRAWEAQSGLRFADLSMEGRREANRQMAEMRASSERLRA